MVVPLVLAYFIDLKVGAEQSYHDVTLANRQLNTKMGILDLFIKSNADLYSPSVAYHGCNALLPCGDDNTSATVWVRTFYVTMVFLQWTIA